MKKRVLAVSAVLSCLLLPVEAKWTISAGGQWGSITDSETGWVLGANLKSSASAVISSVKTAGTGSVLDLSETDGFTITQIGQGGLSPNNQSVLRTSPVTEIILPDSVTSFANYAFQDPNAGPHNLGKITIGRGVTSIPSSAFMKCTALKEVHCNGFPFSETYTQSANLADLPGYETRVFYPVTDEKWAAFVKSSYVTEYDTLSAEIKAKYTYTDGIVPKYLSTRTGLKNFWLIPEGEVTDSVKLIVAANGTEYGEANPAYCVDPVEYGMSALPVACSVSQYVKEDRILRKCVSCTLQKSVEGIWTDVETVAGHEYSFAPAEAGNYKLVWDWEVAGYRIPSLADLDLSSIGCTLTVRSDSTMVVDDYWPVGASVTFSASGAAPFLRWVGDIEKPEESVNPLTLTMNAPMDFLPLFKTNWQVADDGKSMSDGYWKLPISGTAGHVIGSGTTVLLPCGVLDLTKPISDGLPVTSVGASAFQNNRVLVELILPASTITSIGNNAFDGCSNLACVEPFLPDSVASLGIAAFSQCTSLAGDLVIGGSGKPVTFVDSSWAYQFRDCSKIRSITFGENVGALRKYSFWNCTGFKELRFYGKPSIYGTQAQVGGTFQGAAINQRAYLPKSSEGWYDFMTNATYMTTWANLSADAQKLYTDAFPGDPLPKGRSTASAGFGVQWIFTFADKGGMKLLFK